MRTREQVFLTDMRTEEQVFGERHENKRTGFIVGGYGILAVPTLP